MHPLKTFALTPIALLAVGCSHFAATYEADPIFVESDLFDSKSQTVNSKELKSRVMHIKLPADRDDLLFEIIRISDKVCSLHEAHIVAMSNAWNLSTGSLTSVFSALGTVVGGEIAKAGLAAAATVTNSTRSLINEEVYVKTLAPIIVRSIETARSSYRKNILAHRGVELKDYSIEEGFLDIQEYHRRCSFYFGLIEVSKALDSRRSSKRDIDAEIEVLRGRVLQLKGTDSDILEINAKMNELYLQRSSAPE